MNAYFNVTIPEFHHRYGTDWEAFQSIIEDAVDYVIERTIKLYELFDISIMPTQVVRILMDELDIDYHTTPPELYKTKLRMYARMYAKKGHAGMYRDSIFSITGTLPTLYNGLMHQGWLINRARMNHMRFSQGNIIYQILIKPHTDDPEMLDAITALLKGPEMRPAFYDMVLIDEDEIVTRVI